MLIEAITWFPFTKRNQIKTNTSHNKVKYLTLVSCYYSPKASIQTQLLKRISSKNVNNDNNYATNAERANMYERIK